MKNIKIIRLFNKFYFINNIFIHIHIHKKTILNNIIFNNMIIITHLIIN